VPDTRQITSLVLLVCLIES